MSQGLKPGFVAGLDTRAKARAYLRGKDKGKSGVVDGIHSHPCAVKLRMNGAPECLW